MKRLSDILVSLILIVILLPIMLLIGIIIKIDSTGPIFYCRKKNGQRTYRIGKNAKPFYYFKFRSMINGTEEVSNFGSFIRRWHLDELPELFLVLIGHMSLVGPRPIFRNSIIRNRKAYLESLKVRPGITGPFQINRGDHSMEHMINLNNWYADHAGFITDLIIIIKTPLVIIKQKFGVNKTFSIL